MFSVKKQAAANGNTKSIMDALNAAQAMIIFDLKGNIVEANDNFLQAVGYEKSEIIGKHHRIFVSKKLAASDEYAAFWKKLAKGEHHTGEFERWTKDGSVLWLEASYNPIYDANGKPQGVVKFAIDITARKMRNADVNGQLVAISRSQAVIEFDLESNILKANDNFCDAMGYSASEIVGKQHRMFVEEETVASQEYKIFWDDLRAGQFKAAEFKRLGKGGKVVWIQASYNPILDASGNPYKIVKYATDITERKQTFEALSKNLQLLAEGNLSARMSSFTNPEFSQLSEAFNETMAKLSDLVTDIQTSSGTMSNGITGIAQGAQDLSERTEKQAASLQETNAALEDISSNITATASSAKNAHAAAQEAESRAIQGDNVVRSAISAMDRIEDGSKKITEIISVIESISFQTNLLALNAAVEAARAGESGKGFAVVASEVRTLAQRSSEAANDITQLIESSSAQVVEGADLVRNTGNVLNEIKSSIDSVVENVNEISEASADQANAISGISAAVSGIDASTQSNAQMAQQSASSANSLTKEAERLIKLAGVFGASGQAEAPLMSKSA